MNASFSYDQSAYLNLEFRTVRGASHLVKRRHKWPFSIGRQFWLSEAPEEAVVLLQSVSGTINAGDRTRTRIQVHDGAAARILPQGAVSVHRAGALEGSAFESTELLVGHDSSLEYRMEPRILFPRARFGQQLKIQVAHSSFAVIQDSAIIIRDSSGSYFDEYFSETLVEVDGDVMARERSMITGWGSLPVAVRRMPAFGQVLVIDPSNSAASSVPEPVPCEGAYAAISALPHGVGTMLRVAAVDGAALRAATDQFVCALQSRRRRDQRE